MSKRTIALVAAVILAAVATVALVSYVQSAGQNKKNQGQLVSVFVAKQIIPARESGDTAISQALVQQISVPLLARADDAITSLEQIKGKVAAIDIQKNEQILASRFVLPGGQIGTSLSIPTGLQAISVQVTVPPGVAGFIHTGDTVSVIAQLAVPKGRGATTTAETVRYLIQDVAVLGVGELTQVAAANGSTQTSTTQATGQVLLTLAVNAQQAEKLVFANLQGQIYFTLIPKGQGAQNTPGRSADNIFGR